MKAIVGIIVFIVACKARPNLHADQRDWMQFKILNNKVYSSQEEEDMRMNIFFDNHEKIKQHNDLYELGLVTYRQKMNTFGDLTNHEFINIMNGLRHNESQIQSRPLFDDDDDAFDVPESVDWREKGAVTPVKDQGQCGSCWAFSTTGSLEGQHFLKTGKLVSLSEQNLVDCSGSNGNEGCNGGLMDQAFKYIKSNGGLDTEKSYPYTAEDGKCRFKKQNVGATVKSFVDIPSGNEKALKKAVANIGPISIAIDASDDSFQFYSEGVYHSSKCSSESLDHGVLAVGYGTENGLDYWLVKNSWGTTWGDQGYIKMSRNRNNNCGIATQASYPTV